jgi:hypothetical protein
MTREIDNSGADRKPAFAHCSFRANAFDAVREQIAAPKKALDFVR